MGIIRGSSRIPHQELMLTQLSGSIMASANQILPRGSDQILTITIIIRGSNKLVLEEADRSIHDALCVIRCLVKKRFLIAGGGAPETEVSRELMLHANSLAGADAYCFKVSGIWLPPVT